LDVGLGVEQRADPGPDQRLVVHQHHPDHGAPFSGSSASTVNPPDAPGSARRRPPSAVTRSRIPIRPYPGTGGRRPPAPSSSTRTVSSPAAYVIRTVAVAFPACRVTLVSASW